MNEQEKAAWDEYSQKMEARVAALEQATGLVNRLKEDAKEWNINALEEGTRVKLLSRVTLGEQDLFDAIVTENDLEEIVSEAVMKSEGVVGKLCEWSSEYREVRFRMLAPLEVTVLVKDKEVRVTG